MTDSRRGLTRTIVDPIHGAIPLSETEIKVIEHPLFRRLNHVKQNSLLYNVFPSAKHTRFEHSLGAMHCADKMLRALVENGTLAKGKGNIADGQALWDLSESSKGVGVDLLPVLGADEQKIFTAVRLAALLHDVGHGPLSHLFDKFSPTREEFETILHSDPALTSDYPHVLQALKKELPHRGQQIEHEHVSQYFTFRILHKVAPDQLPLVLDILLKQSELGKPSLFHTGRALDIRPLLRSIVSSAPIDSDRLDYLKRDSVFAGVPYGLYSEDRVLKSLLAYVEKNSSINLGIKRSGLHAIENLILARYELYVQVYGHKTNEAFKAMLECISAAKKSFPEWSGCRLDALQFQQLYESLDDNEFLRKLETELPDLSSLIGGIRNRRLWKRVREIEDYVDSEDETDRQKKFKAAYEEISSELGGGLYLYQGDRWPLKDYQKKGSPILEKGSAGAYVVSNQTLDQGTQILRSLAKGLKILRVYSTAPDAEVSKIRKLADSIFTKHLE